MSKHHLRADKTCLNCGTYVADRYCPHCGQENLEPKESVWHMVVHFFNDITHFDGKFFSTIKLLFTKPGFLSEEYMKGRRVDYLNPIRMYLFVSFVLFFLRFSLPESHYSHSIIHTDTTVTNVDSLHLADSLQIADARDTILQGGNIALWRVETDDTVIESNKNGRITGILNNADDTTIAQFEARQKNLPKHQRDNFFSAWIAKRFLAVREYQAAHPKTFSKEVNNIFEHSIPKMLFVSIPIFTLLLWLLYVRSRKNYYFVAHGIFTIHLYCAIYLMIIVLMPFEYIDSNKVNFIKKIILFIVPAIYLYLAMKRFYKQGHLKTSFKFILLLASSAIVFIVLTLIFSINSLLAIASSGTH